MTEGNAREAGMERLLRSALKPGPGAADLCPDPGLLAAFVEGSLTANEEAALDGHIAACGRCQEALAVLAHALPEDASADVAEASPSRWFTWAARPRLRWLVPISAAATVAVVFFATRPLIAPEGDVPGSDVVRMAQAPAPPAEAPQSGLDEFREKPAAAAEKSELAGVPGPLADTQAPPGKPAHDKRAVEPAAEMMAARAASEAKRAQAMAPAAPTLPAAQAAATPPPAAGQMAAAEQAANVAVQEGVVRKEAVAEKDRPARPAGAPARLVRALDTGSVTIREPGGAALWRVGAGGQIARSVDGGATWQRQASGVTADLLAGAAPSPTTCWVVGAAGTVLLTTDGERWERRPFALAVDLAAVEALSVRAATITTRDGQRFETLDGGQTWSPKKGQYLFR